VIRLSSSFAGRNARWVFVTGAPRSGTTALGSALASAPGTVYVHEPFNPLTGTNVFGPIDPAPPVNADNRTKLRSVVTDLQDWKLDTRRGRFANDTTLTHLRRQLVGGRTDQSLRAARLRRSVDAVIVKDPVGLFLAEALHVDHGWPVVAIVRNPVAVVRSMLALEFSSREQADRQIEVVRTLGIDVRPHTIADLRRIVETGDPVASHAVRWLCSNLWIRHQQCSGRVVAVSNGCFHRDPVGMIQALSGTLGIRTPTPSELDKQRRRERRLDRLMGPLGSPSPASRQFPLTSENEELVRFICEPAKPFIDEISEPW
jgi:hypothetical protein